MLFNRHVSQYSVELEYFEYVTPNQLTQTWLTVTKLHLPTYFEFELQNFGEVVHSYRIDLQIFFGLMELAIRLLQHNKH